MAKRRVVILGGGFAGYYSARELESRMRRSDRDEIEVTLIARDNFLTFTPMLPSVPASTLAPRHVVTPLRARLSHTRFIRAEITAVDTANKTVSLEGASVRTGVTPSQLPYDELVVGLGSTTNYFGIPGAAELALTMKSVPDAMKIRNRVLDLLEAADAQDSERRRRGILTLVIVGMGFSGCETAGELIEFLRESIKLYPNIAPGDLRVMLVGLDKECMPEIGARLGRYGRRVLEEDGVEIRLETAVISVAEDHVMLRTPEGVEERIDTRTVLWTAGVAPLPAARPLASEGSKGRVLTDNMLRSPVWEGVWALGDAAAIPNTEGPGFCAPTAQHAMRQAETLAKNIIATHRGTPLVPYRYRPLGLMASLGHHKAVALAMGIPISGFIAWWLWRTYYLLRMPGFERKLRVALDWTIDLFLPRDTVVLRYEAPIAQLSLTAPQALAIASSPPNLAPKSLPPPSAPKPLPPLEPTSRVPLEPDTSVDRTIPTLSLNPCGEASSAYVLTMTARTAVAAFATFALMAFAIPSVSQADGGVPACVHISAYAHFDGAGYNHMVDIANSCAKAAKCIVSTNVNPEANYVRVAAGDTASVNTFRGSPAREFTPSVSCTLE